MLPGCQATGVVPAFIRWLAWGDTTRGIARVARVPLRAHGLPGRNLSISVSDLVALGTLIHGYMRIRMCNQGARLRLHLPPISYLN